MKALILVLLLVSVYEAQARETKESRQIAGEVLKLKKKKKESMWARDLRGKLAGQGAVIRTL